MANKPDWSLKRSAVIPFFIKNNELKVVLVTTNSQKNPSWIFPKGKIEPGMSSHDSAAKEAWEEAGVEGKVSDELFDCYEHRKWGNSSLVDVFLQEVTNIKSQWPEMKTRRRAIMDLDSAIEIIQPKQKDVLIKFQQSFG